MRKASRAPYLPALSGVLPMGLFIILAYTVGESMWETYQSGKLVPARLVVMSLAWFLPLVLFLGTFPLLRRLRIVHPYARPPYGRRWVAYWAILLLALTLGYTLRGLIQVWLGDVLADARSVLMTYVGPPLVMIALLHIAEEDSAYVDALRREEAVLLDEIEQLFRSREALLLARSRGLQAIAASLGVRSAPRLERVRREVARARAGEAIALDEVLAEVDALAEDEFRLLAHALHPSVVRAGLVPALRALVARFDAVKDVAFEAEGEPRLDEAGVLAAYRIVEAALENVRRHARASRVSVTVAARHGSVALEVADDGVGFAPAEHPWGLGFSLVESRVALAGGSWQLDAAPGGGTRLRVKLPVSWSAGSRG